MKEEKSLNEIIVSNILKILNDKGLKPADISRKSGMSQSDLSKRLKGSTKFSLSDVSKIANALSIREIDIITYPDIYVRKEDATSEPIEAVLQIKLKKDKKDQVLKLIFGDNDIEILNK